MKSRLIFILFIIFFLSGCSLLGSDKDTKKLVADGLTPKELYNEGKFKKISSRPFLSSVAIVVSMKRGDNEKIPEIEEVEAVACAIQNMCLTATAYGLGSFWSSPKIIYTPEMNKFLKLNPEDKCLGVLYVGYPSIDWPKGQRKPIEYLTEWNG